jgi:hypothetical protein
VNYGVRQGEGQNNMKVLKIHTLEKGWCDKDYVMLHAVFQLLVDFIDQEKPDQIVDWNSDPKHKHAWKEIRSLYRWWSQTRLARRSPLEEKGLKKPPMRWKKIPGSENCQLVDYDKNKYASYEAALKKHWRLEKKWDAEDQKNLHRLIRIRRFLWI